MKTDDSGPVLRGPHGRGILGMGAEPAARGASRRQGAALHTPISMGYVSYLWYMWGSECG